MKKLLQLVAVILILLLPVRVFGALNATSATLDGTNQAFRADDSTSLDITGDISLEMWIKIGSGGVSQCEINDCGLIYKVVNNASNMSWKWSLTAGSGSGKLKMQFDFSSDGSVGGTLTRAFDNADSFATADEGTWHHVAVTADVSVPTVTFYIDGTARTTNHTNTAATSIFSGTGRLSLGASAEGTSAFFLGKIDEARITSGLRYTGNFTPQTLEYATDGTTVALYHLNDNDGSSGLSDSSGNANTLTNLNSATFTSDVPFVGQADASATVRRKIFISS